MRIMQQSIYDGLLLYYVFVYHWFQQQYDQFSSLNYLVIYAMCFFLFNFAV